MLCAAATVAVSLYNHKENLVEPPGGTLFTAAMTDVVILRRYIENFIYPGNLSYFYYIEPVTSLADGRLWLSGAICVGVSSLLIWLASERYRMLAVFGLLWFVGGLGPNLNFIAVNDVMHDRYVYLATPGFWLMLVAGISGAHERLKVRGMNTLASSNPGLAMLLLFAFLLAFACQQRAVTYADQLTLAQDSARKEPLSSNARILHGNLLRMEGVKLLTTGKKEEGNQLLDAAIQEIQTGIDSPDFKRYLDPINAYVSLAIAYYRRERIAEAAPLFDKALRPPPGRKPASADLTAAELFVANQLMNNAKPLDALEHFDRALAASPQERSIQYMRAQALLSIQDSLERGGRNEDAWRFHHLAQDALQSILKTDAAYAAAQQLLRSMRPPPGLEPLR